MANKMWVMTRGWVDMTDGAIDQVVAEETVLIHAESYDQALIKLMHQGNLFDGMVLKYGDMLERITITFFLENLEVLNQKLYRAIQKIYRKHADKNWDLADLPTLFNPYHDDQVISDDRKLYQQFEKKFETFNDHLDKFLAQSGLPDSLIVKLYHDIHEANCYNSFQIIKEVEQEIK